jgi:hypothetical protein
MENENEKEINSTVVASNYLSKIGKPENYVKVVARPITGHKFRVNLWVSDQKFGSKVGKSHVVTVNNKGEILEMEV